MEPVQSQRVRKVGDYRLDQLLFEGPTYQDWAGTHVALDKERARVRIYVVEPGASADARAAIVKAARREYSILNGISHPGILRAKGYTEHERGPALIYDYLPSSQRLDHFLAERGDDSRWTAAWTSCVRSLKRCATPTANASTIGP